MSIAVHAGAAALLILVPAGVHELVKPRQTVSTLVAPKPVEEYKPKPADMPKPKIKPLVLPPTLKLAKLPEIRHIDPPKLVPPPLVEPPKIVAQIPTPAPRIVSAPIAVKPAVKTDVFATANTTNLGPKAPAVHDVKTDNFGAVAAAAGDKTAVRTVQTGGFGDPNGVAPSKNSTGRGVVMAAFGNSDMPVGSGQGGGNGRKVVGSAGFGGGFSSAGPGGNGTGAARGTIHSSGFGESVAVAVPAKRDSPGAPRETQVEILGKPKPVYTAEAKELKIEGQVAVEVQFTAGGSVRVLRVVKGLGHGLDEAAQQAALQIRFKPAMRDGAAVDSTARVYIVFQLT